MIGGVKMTKEARKAQADYMAEYHRRNKERLAEYRKAWAKRNPDKIRSYRERAWERKANSQ